MFSKLIYTKLFEFYAQLLAHIGKTSVDSIKQCFAVEIILRVKPLFFEFSPKSFRYIQMRTIRRQIHDKESSVLPIRNPLFDNVRFMYTCVV